MIFDKFKNIDMPDIDVEADMEYVEKLELIAKQKHKKPIFSVIGTVAASLVVVVCVAVWAIIGRGIRNDINNGNMVPAADSDEFSVTVSCDVMEEKLNFETENEVILRSIISFGFGGEDAKELIGILEALEGFDEKNICMCASVYNVSFNGKSYGLRLSNAFYARHNGGQIELSHDTAMSILEIFERQLVIKNRVYPEAAETELMLTSREGTKISRYVFKDENSDKLLTFALSADYQEGIQPYDAEYKLGIKYSLPARFGLSLKGDTPFVACEKGVYYLNKNEVDELKKAIVGGAVAQNQIKAEPSYEAPYQARAAVTAYPDGAEKYMFYNDDSDELLLLLESYYYQPTNDACSCQPSVCITPTHLRNEYPRANSYIVAFCADSTHVYTDSGHSHVVVSYEDGERIKEILYKNCKEPYVSDTQNQ